MLKTIVAFRPYYTRIRIQVFHILEQLRYDTKNAVIFPKGTPDEEILRALATIPVPSALLCPFHTHTDTNNSTVDGLSLILQIRKAYPEFQKLLVLMPVSQTAHGGYSLRRQQLPESSLQGIIPLYERELENPHQAIRQLRDIGF